MNQKKWWNWKGVKAHYKKTMIFVTLYYFLGVPYLNFNHVIIVKDFHIVFAYYGRSKLKEMKWKKNVFFISHDVMLKYICAKNIYVTSY
jgi:hypothetical protein